MPATAIVRDGDRDAVWVVEGKVARRRPVTVGAQGEDAVAVTAGLEVGEQVVVRGADHVREGQELVLTATEQLAALEAVDVTRTYELGDSTVQALRGVSLRVGPGDYVAVMGPSGSGKSTLLHCAAGLDRPASGEVRLGGGPIGRLREPKLTETRRRLVGFVFQSYNLLDSLSVWHNVLLPQRLAGVRADRAWTREVLRRVGLTGRENDRPAQLSGGQRQRVAIARALAGRPQVIFADEPTGNLDSVRGGEVMDLLEGLNAERGVALVVVTHEITPASVIDSCAVEVDAYQSSKTEISLFWPA